MRVHTVQAAWKPPGTCESCREPVTIGQAYKYIKPRYGGKRVRHETCPTWRRSEMTGSKLATVYAGQEDAEDQLDAIDLDGYERDTRTEELLEEVRNALEAASAAANECASEYQDGIDAMPEGLQQGPIAEESREKVEILESYASELDSWEPERDAPGDDEENEAETCVHCEGSGECDAFDQDPDNDAACAEGHGCTREQCGNCDGSGTVEPDKTATEALDAEWLTWAEEVIDSARDKVNELEL